MGLVVGMALEVGVRAVLHRHWPGRVARWPPPPPDLLSVQWSPAKTSLILAIMDEPIPSECPLAL